MPKIAQKKAKTFLKTREKKTKKIAQAASTFFNLWSCFNFVVKEIEGEMLNATSATERMSQ